jgi:regulator of protease activity HflC (stomatin/prohibitin superfamily)
VIKQILDFLLQWWHALRFWDVLDQERVGFIRRLGRAHRDMTAGINWRWPLIESAVTFDGQEGTYVLDPQSLRTLDGVNLVLRLKVTCQIIDARAHQLNVYDALNNIQDVAAGECGEAVREASAADVYSGKVLKRIGARTRSQGKRWGMKVSEVQFLDCAPARSYRLWQSTFTAAGQE